MNGKEMEMKIRNGQAILCFPRNATWFQGYFLDKNEHIQIGILGIEIPIDDCVKCPDGGYKEYCLTFYNYENDTKATLIVIKTGGEACSFTSKDEDDGIIEYCTSVLLNDEKAVEAIETSFPTIIAQVGESKQVLYNCYICLGEMKLQNLVFSKSTA